MTIYDYQKGKERTENILDNELTIVEQDSIPVDSAFLFSMTTQAISPLLSIMDTIVGQVPSLLISEILLYCLQMKTEKRYLN